MRYSKVMLVSLVTATLFVLTTNVFAGGNDNEEGSSVRSTPISHRFGEERDKEKSSKHWRCMDRECMNYENPTGLVCIGSCCCAGGIAALSNPTTFGCGLIGMLNGLGLCIRAGHSRLDWFECAQDY